ncbi:LPXTG cell wall anchor domain-containing protein [Enterococcus sp. LJL120]
MMLVGVVGSVGEVYAAGDAGGQVQNDSQITFYEETTDSTTSSSTIESSSTTESSSTVLPDTSDTPGGKLPQTGEVIRNYSLIGGTLLLVLLLFLFYRKKKDNEKEGEA